MIDLAILAIFLGACAGTFLMVWRKIPLLVQVPERLIEESFITRPPRLKLFLGPIVEFFRSERYREVYRTILVWALHRLRLWLLRFERLVSRMLEALRNEERLLSETEERYWSELKTWKQESRDNGADVPKAVLASEPPPPAWPKLLSPRQSPRRSAGRRGEGPPAMARKSVAHRKKSSTSTSSGPLRPDDRMVV